MDVAEPRSVEAGVKAVLERWGRVDVLVNNAGILRDAQLVKWKDGAVAGTMTDEAWDAVLGVNLKGVFLCTRAVVPHMIAGGGGVVLSASSVVGLYGNFGQTNYVATKAGVIGMTRTWARELGKHKIRVNAVAPGFVATEILRAMPAEDPRLDGRAHAPRAHGPARGHRERLRLARLGPGRLRHRPLPLRRRRLSSSARRGGARMKPIYIAAYHQSVFGKLMGMTVPEIVANAVAGACDEIGGSRLRPRRRPRSAPPATSR